MSGVWAPTGAHRAWRLDGKTGRYDTLLHGQADWPFDVRVQADDSRLEARGSLDARGTLRATVTEKTRAGVVFIPFHFAEAAANLLTIDALDPQAKIPEFKACAVKIEAVSEDELARPEVILSRGRY